MTLSALLQPVCLWLQATDLSALVASRAWIIPALQTVHILAVSVVSSSALLISLRRIGILRGDQSQEAMARRFLPFVWWPLPVLLVTGALLIAAEPARSLQNPSFGLKMGCLAAALVVMAIYQSRLGHAGSGWDSSATRRATAIALATASLLLWPCIIVAARWIAYTQT